MKSRMGVRPKTVFLTGASSGIGVALAGQLVREGYVVWGTARRRGGLARFPALHEVEMTLEEPDSVRAAWNQALAEAGQIDVVIQNAGSGLIGAIEDVPMEEAGRLWRVLVEGPLLVLKLAAEHLRPRGEGIIMGVSSLAAEMPICFGAHYSAGKAAFSALLGGLWMELEPFGVRVIDLRPGDIRTAFNEGRQVVIPDNSAYTPWVKAAWKRDDQLMKEAPPPDAIARAAIRLLQQETPPVVAREGSFFQSVVAPMGPRLLTRRALLQSIRAHYGLNPIDAGQRERP